MAIAQTFSSYPSELVDTREVADDSARARVQQARVSAFERIVLPQEERVERVVLFAGFGSRERPAVHAQPMSATGARLLGRFRGAVAEAVAEHEAAGRLVPTSARRTQGTGTVEND